MNNKQNTGRHQSATGSHVAVSEPGRFSRLKTHLNISKRGLYIACTLAAVVLIVVIAVVLRALSEKRSYSEYYNRAVESYSAGDYDSALTDLRKAAGLNQTDECLMLMAGCYEAQENLDKALEILRMLDTRDAQVAERIAAVEKKRDLLNSAAKVTIAGTEYDIGTPSLTLRDMALTDESLDDIARLYALTSLNLSQNGLSDISALTTLGGLSVLELSENNISDLSPLAELPGLRILYLDNNPITDFSPLFGLQNLTMLSIKGIEISDSRLKELSEALPACAIYSENAVEQAHDITLGGVTFKSDVDVLNLSNMGISDISALSSCKNLKNLDLSGNSISDLSPLMDIPGLKSLNIKNNLVTDLRPLMALITLESIHAEGNSISSTVALGSLFQLKELYLADNPISDCSGLAKLSGLETLGLENTGLTDEGLEYLKGLSSLKMLSITDNPDLGGEAVDALQQSIGACYIEHSALVYSIEIGGEKYREDVTELDLSNRGLTDISPLGLFNGLESVNLRGNSLENIYILQFTTELKELDLACNNISDATAIASLHALESLDISGNKLTTITPFLSLDKLKLLDLSGNDISPEKLERLRSALPDCNIIFD